MAWYVDVTVQQRGTKDERGQWCRFETRQLAEAAVEQLEADLQAAGPDSLIVMKSAGQRISFLKQDFRRTRLYERAPQQRQTRRVI